jgi:hypothetical protein
MNETIEGLMHDIRDFLQHPRRLDPLLKDPPNWNMLTSAMDVVQDTEYAIRAYEATKEKDIGMLYLRIYGLLQALYVQQDGLESMVRALDGNNNFKIESEPEAKHIRQVRHDTVGHPTKQGGTQVKQGKAGEQVSHFLSRQSMNDSGYTLMRTSNLKDVQFIQISIPSLIVDNRTLVQRVLLRTKTKLEEMEMTHRKQFRGEKLLDCFPPTTGYYFEKVFMAIQSPSFGNTPMGEISLTTLKENLAKFRFALEKRGLLTKVNHMEEDLAEIEFPLEELDKYFKGAKGDFLSDSRVASIFAYFVKNKLEALQHVAEEIDEEYAEDIT